MTAPTMTTEFVPDLKDVPFADLLRAREQAGVPGPLQQRLERLVSGETGTAVAEFNSSI